MSGKVRAFVGPMYASKTAALIMKGRKHLKAKEYGRGEGVVFVRPSRDNRQDDPMTVIAHDESELLGVEVVIIDSNHPEEMLDNPKVIGAGVILIDEGQFFVPRIGDVVMALYMMGKKVYFAGLDTDFMTRPFESTASVIMLPVARVCKLTAACKRCGETAQYSLRLINGKLASESSPVIMTEDREGATYEPVCASCCKNAHISAGNKVFL